MKIYITGSTGFVGRNLLKSLLLNREDLELVDLKFSSLDTDVKSNHLFKNPNENFLSNDIVIHLAARVHILDEATRNSLSEFRKINVNKTLKFAKQAAEAGIKRFIFISSVKVNGEATQFGRPFTENDTPNPQDAYGTSKYEAEQGLLRIAQETGMQVVIIRPPLVYGAGVKANFASMIRAVKRGIPLPLGAINNLRSLVYVGNLVDFIVHCITHPNAANQIFMVSDGNDVSTTTLLKACIKALGVQSRLVPVPQNFLELMLKLIRKKQIAQRLCGNLQVDISKARQLLGWTPPYTMEQGLQETVLNNVNNEKS